MSTTWLEAELIGQKEEIKGTNRFWLRILADSVVRYDAGQFFTFDFPTGEKRADRWRSYSIANTCDGSNIIELCVSYKKNGMASEYLFNTINKGDKVRFKGPEGTFTLPSKQNGNIVMLATGTGVVPFRAMLQKISTEKISSAPIHLIYGTRKVKDILYFEELEDYAHFLNDIKIDICLSRETRLPKNLNNINFHSGYIHPVYLQQKIITPESTIMVCGWQQMMDEAVIHLMNTLKVDRKQIRLELFG